MASDTIVGYTYCTDTLCPVCTAAAVGVDYTAGPRIPDLIDQAGRAAGINVDNERTFDSGEWPKVIFECSVEGPEERCGNCHGSLVG